MKRIRKSVAIVLVCSLLSLSLPAIAQQESEPDPNEKTEQKEKVDKALKVLFYFGIGVITIFALHEITKPDCDCGDAKPD